jgi:hypothetical protein
LYQQVDYVIDTADDINWNIARDLWTSWSRCSWSSERHIQSIYAVLLCIHQIYAIGLVVLYVGSEGWTMRSDEVTMRTFLTRLRLLKRRLDNVVNPHHDSILESSILVEPWKAEQGWLI